MPKFSLRLSLRAAAALLLLGSVALWMATGAHRGWTQTQLTEMRRDEVTGIDYPVQREGLVAGVDLLGAGAGLAAVLFAVSFAVSRPRLRATS